jgi:hypothetical protein
MNTPQPHPTRNCGSLFPIDLISGVMGQGTPALNRPSGPEPRAVESDQFPLPLSQVDFG